MTRVAVIGAGAGGLAASRRLADSGVDHVVFEAGSHVGGLWVFGNDNGYAQAYRSLHINSEHAITAFEGVPFDPATPVFPDHRAMAAYFADFAERFGIVPRIRFNTRVTGLERDGDGWAVLTEAGERESFDAVVIAPGHQNEPRHPEFAERFTGRYLHSQEYRVPDDFTGRRVLVIGVGNSALDIAADICTVTERTVLAARSPVLILPRMLFGWPTARVLGRIEKPWIPWGLNRRIRELIGWIAHGRMERWGLVTPRTRIHPTSHPTVVHHMEWNRIVAKPGIAAVEGATVEFEDGSSEEFDVMIAGTGYRIALPFLPSDLAPTRGRELDLYRRIVLPDAPGLFFLGFFNVSGGANVPLLDRQASWIAAVLTGRVALPSADRMRAEIDSDQAYIARRYPDSPRYGLELDPKRYLPRLAADLKAAS